MTSFSACCHKCKVHATEKSQKMFVSSVYSLSFSQCAFFKYCNLLYLESSLQVRIVYGWIMKTEYCVSSTRSTLEFSTKNDLDNPHCSVALQPTENVNVNWDTIK